MVQCRAKVNKCSVYLLYCIFTAALQSVVAYRPTWAVGGSMDHLTGLPHAESVKRLQVEGILRAAAKVGHNMWPVACTELARCPVDRVLATMMQHEAEDAATAVTARHPAQLHAGVGCHDNAQNRRSRRSWQQITQATANRTIVDNRPSTAVQLTSRAVITESHCLVARTTKYFALTKVWSQKRIRSSPNSWVSYGVM